MVELPVCAAADPAPRPARFRPPAGAVDCHFHVFGPADRFPYRPDRTYTPPDAPLSAYGHLLDTLGLTDGVIVQPSVYGADNRCILHALDVQGPASRGVVVVEPGIGDDDLTDLHRRGVRGVRIILAFSGGDALDGLDALARRLAPLGWHIQIFGDVSTIADRLPALAHLPVPLVFDHFGYMPAWQGVNEPGFRAMLSLLGQGKAWVKVSGAYRITAEKEPPYGDVAPFATKLIAANPDHLIWGTDWPHPAIATPMPNDGALLDMLDDWCPDTTTRDRILVDNPRRLYGF